MSKIYLALPYTGMEEKSFRIANRVAGRLISEGHIVFSPISHSHPIALAMGLPTDAGFWWLQNEEFLRWCDKVLVLRNDNWPVSKGVQKEVVTADLFGKVIEFEYVEDE